MRRRGATALTVAFVLLMASAPTLAQAGGSERTQPTLISFDGHRIPVTLYRPWSANADHPVPILLHSHGFSGSRTNAEGAFQPFIDAGFGVISIDMRGHGEARQTSEARIHHVDYEVKDVMVVIDWVADLPWVLMDGPNDPRVGAMGYSYGGAFQLLTAAFDDRLDVIAPEITWNSLPESLAPGGAPKSAWIDFFYAAGNALARVHPTIHEGYAYTMSTNQLPDGSTPGTYDLLSQLQDSSPASYPGAIDIPTLLIQGTTDTLFNLNQAVHNYEQINATGAPVKLVTHLGGHLLNFHALNSNLPPGGMQPDAGAHACGSEVTIMVAWFQRHLQENATTDTGPGVCMTLDDGTTVTGDAYPIAVGRSSEIPEGPTFVMGVPGQTWTQDLMAAEDETIIAGVPTLAGTVEAPSDTIVYWSLEVVSPDGATRVVNSQIVPLRSAGALDGGAEPFAIELGGIAVRLLPGDTLRLAASTSADQYAHNSARSAGLAVVSELEVTLPVVEDGPECVGDPDAPDACPQKEKKPKQEKKEKHPDNAWGADLSDLAQAAVRFLLQAS